MLTKREFALLFRVGDVMNSGGNRTQLEIVEIGEEVVIIRPTASNKNSHRLAYGKLNATIEGFNEIDPNRIERTFQKILTDRNQKNDHTNETYLYGVAREYISRKYGPASEDNSLPEEIPSSDYPKLTEGAKKTIVVNAYERDLNAKPLCIEHWGDSCVVCDMSFGTVYGDFGKGFIHVHHLKPLSEIGQQYELNPVQDLRPVCPNCHAMLHKSKKILTIEALRDILRAATASSSN